MCEIVILNVDDIRDLLNNVIVDLNKQQQFPYY